MSENTNYVKVEYMTDLDGNKIEETSTSTPYYYKAITTSTPSKFERIDYVLVFAFDWTREKVLLIKKSKPEFQAGLLNGVGGKIQQGEIPEQAAIREFKEETGLDIGGLKELAHLTVNDPKNANIAVFYTTEIEECKSDEPYNYETLEGACGWYDMTEIRNGLHPQMPHIAVLIQAVISKVKGINSKTYSIDEIPY